MDKIKRSYSVGKFLRDYWELLAGYRASFILLSIILIISNSVPFAISYFVGKIVDFFTFYTSGQSLGLFYLYVICIAFAGGMQVWLRFFAKNRMSKISFELRKKVRLIAMTKMMDFELKWHEKEETGKKMHKINAGGESVFRTMSFFSNDGIRMFTSIFGSILLFIFLNWKYSLFAFIYMAIYLSGEIYYHKKVSYWEDRLSKMKEKISGKVHESAANVLTVKSLGLKDIFRQSMKNYEEEYHRVWLNNYEINHTKDKIIKIFSAIGHAIFIFLVGFDVLNSRISIGSIVIFVSYFERLRYALEMYTNSSAQMIELRSGVGRIMTILGRETIKREAGYLKEIEENWNKIEFKEVSFRYKDKLVLDNFNLSINKGDKIGIAGRSGCGKSTLVKLILGLYKVQKGEILIDGVNINKYKHSSITKLISVVLQDSEMFNMPLIDNITISAQKIDYNKLRKSIEVSQLSPLINKLPKGLNTLIGEKGYKVSGGERQRIGLARAIYKDSDFLILDEATSHLDSKTEKSIQEALEKHLKDKTLIVVAHRLSTLRKVKEIIVMDEGEIKEKASFEALIKRRGKFFGMYNLQRRP